MNKTIAAIALLIFSGLALIAQTPCTRHVETAGGFSYCPPVDWTPRTKAGQKFYQFFAPQSPPFTPNLNVKDEAATVTLNAYVDAAVKSLLETKAGLDATDMKLISRTDFVTASKLKGLRVIFHTELKGHVYQTMQYIFNGKNNTKLILTGTMLASDTASSKIFDDTAKTLRFDK